jgi:hypothetical protein
MIDSQTDVRADEEADEQTNGHTSGHTSGHTNGQQYGPADLQRQAQLKRRTPSSRSKGQSTPRRVGQPRPRGDR